MTKASVVRRDRKVGVNIQDDTQSANGYVRRQKWTDPAAASATLLLSASALDGATLTTVSAQPDFARKLALVASGATSSNVTIAGTDIRGNAISETIALNGTTPVNTLNAFKTVTSVVKPTVGATTMNLGTTAALGMDRCMSEAAVLDAFIDGVRETTAATVAFDSSVVSKNTVTTNTAPNASRDISIVFVPTEVTDYTDTTS